MSALTQPVSPAAADRCQHALWDELARAASEVPDAPFLRMASGDLSFGAMERQASSLAAGLRRLGVAAGANVSLLLPNCAEFVVTWFALARLGAATAPVNTAMRGSLLRDALALVGSKVLVVHETLWPQFEAVRADHDGRRFPHDRLMRGCGFGSRLSRAHSLTIGSASDYRSRVSPSAITTSSGPSSPSSAF